MIRFVRSAFIYSVVGVSLALQLFAESYAQTQSVATVEPELRNPTVVVTGSRKEQAKAFVQEIAPQGWQGAARGVPRWKSPICVGVIGPQVQQGKFIADTISVRAEAVGLETGEPGCSTNLLVIATARPQELLMEMAERHRAVFGFAGDAKTDTSGSDDSLSEFVANDRPVRWRQVIETIGADGIPLDGDPRTGQGGIPTNLPIVRGDATRLRSNVSRQLSRVIIVIDTSQTAGLSLAQVSDYLAFVALADVDPDADLSGFPSILNLFSAQTDHVTEMSDWDKAYLASLYSAKLNAASGTMQYNEITARLADYELD
ncbi:MAG: hypothetical protein FP825_07635 [Hyphomonas sp.]|uniref:hypothetical protein n=1 Tax=Hyphomonas sp. TaxID=87 RepID=UPI0017D239DA|nr:hypothetical protein [Hyphomonas sp.]MBA3068334.1 hypothetical protein [Hyphomonas sp.]MBU3920877.1 hypothetical protein [Alphaproteobacteria bacterium]MBU4060800.1 hypothetical protein [Alphaproteobacteria bacterium]MBU4164784.1 hypothetical protein [Alphaproteobacteria bacterium]